MTYLEQHAALVTYLRAKVEIADWHAVSDAANDLRVLEAQHAAQAVTITSSYMPGSAHFVESVE